MKGQEFADKAFKELLSAKKQFGEYSYHDKGASEVMDVSALVRELRSLPTYEAVDAILRLKAMDDTSLLVSEILIDLQDWDALFENEIIADML